MYSMKQICLIFPIILGFSFSSIVFCRFFFVFPQGYMIYFMIFESFSYFTLFRRLCNPSVRFAQRFSVLLTVTMVAQNCLTIPLQIFANAENKRFRLRSVPSGTRLSFQNL